MDIEWEDIAGQLQAQVAALSLQLAVANAQIVKLTAAPAGDQEVGTDG